MFFNIRYRIYRIQQWNKFDWIHASGKYSTGLTLLILGGNESHTAYSNSPLVKYYKKDRSLLNFSLTVPIRLIFVCDALIKPIGYGIFWPIPLYVGYLRYNAAIISKDDVWFKIWYRGVFLNNFIYHESSKYGLSGLFEFYSDIV
jgi:hypothetical protein